LDTLAVVRFELELPVTINIVEVTRNGTQVVAVLLLLNGCSRTARNIAVSVITETELLEVN
jgi:hypothetical protein